jgi:hypothetical protein
MTNKQTTELNEDFDFGFSIVSEDELKLMEKTLEFELNRKKEELQQTTQAVQDTKSRLEGMRDMVMPLLNNLLANPDKEYIYWPNRTEKIKAFIKKINAYVDD